MLILDISRILKHSGIDFDLQRQIRKSGTAVGALVAEAEYAQSKADFINKLSIALKEANETRYWMTLLTGSHIIRDHSIEEADLLLTEIIKMLVASIKTAKANSLKP